MFHGNSNGAALARPEIIEALRQGREEALAALFMQHRGRLHRMVDIRLDRRLTKRIDPSDVLQDAYFDASQRLADYVRNPSMPFFLWLRFLVGQRLLAIHRSHFGVQKRDVRRESAREVGGQPSVGSHIVAIELSGRLTSPSQAAARTELRAVLNEMLDRLDPVDREILVLRHFEELTNNEAALELGLTKAAASKRYMKAIGRIRALTTPTEEAAW